MRIDEYEYELLLLGGIVLAAHSCTFLRSVVCLSLFRLSHLCTLLEPFDGFRCHLANTLVGSSNTWC